MVQIPTTKRKYYNTTAKTNTLAAYAEALKPAMQNAQQIFMDQQKIKIQTNATKARIEADDYVNNMRLQYQGNPDSPEFKQAIQGGLDDIFNRYGDDIDPIARGEWNLTANKLSGAYELSNNEWIINQRAKNAKLDVAEKMAIDYDLAYKHGTNGNLVAGRDDLESSYNDLYNYAKNNMGETEARALLKDYQKKYTLNYLNGLMNTNPAAAKQMLEDEKVQKVIGENTSQTLKDMTEKLSLKKMEEYVQKRNIQQKYAKARFLDKENPTIADLEAYKDNFDPDITDKEYDRLLRTITEKNENAKTDTKVDIETALELMHLTKTSNKGLASAEKYMDNVNKFIDNVHKKNKDGKLSLNQTQAYKDLAVNASQDEELQQAISNMPDVSKFEKIVPVPSRKPKTDVAIFKTVDELDKRFSELENMPNITQAEQRALVENTDDFMNSVYAAVRNGLIENEEKYINKINKLIKNKVFKHNINQMPQPGFWRSAFRSVGLDWKLSNLDTISIRNDIDSLAANTIENMMKAYNNRDYEEADRIYRDGIEKAIMRRYAKWIPEGTKLEPGKTILNLEGKPCKFMGFGATDICVEVE